MDLMWRGGESETQIKEARQKQQFYLIFFPHILQYLNSEIKSLCSTVFTVKTTGSPGTWGIMQMC